MGRRRGGWEVDVEGHGAAQRGAEVLVTLVVSPEHLRAAYLRRFGLHPFSRYICVCLGLASEEMEVTEE